MIKLGIDRIKEYEHILKNQRIGLITNPTGVNSELVSTAKIVNKHFNLQVLFSPEHGFRGDLQAGVRLEDYIDQEFQCKVYSLYGKNKKPSKEMMDGIDVLCFDIQDVGARYYTFIYTMAYAMMACKEHDKTFVVFDRPNPVGGIEVEGNILDITYRSFVGYYPILQRHGLTVGEIAVMFNKEFDINCNLEVVQMDGYRRSMYFDDTKAHYVVPSPNLPTPVSTLHYLGTCVFEGTNVSEGRGTTRPFSIVGAPWIQVAALLNKLDESNLTGITFREVYFTPIFSKHKDVLCKGIELYVTDKDTYEPVITGYTILKAIEQIHPEFEYRKPYKEGHQPMINLLNGDNFLSENTKTIDEIKHRFKQDKETYLLMKERYHLYE